MFKRISLFILLCSLTQVVGCGASRHNDVSQKTIGSKTKTQGRSRRALIIANGRYQRSKPLLNPSRDARALEDKLSDLQFDVRLEENLDGSSLRQVVSDFANSLMPSDEVYFHFTGHGLDLKSSPMILGTDFSAFDQDDALRQGFHIDSIIQQLSRRVLRTVIVIDTTRENPFVDPARGLVDEGTSSGGLIGKIPAFKSPQRAQSGVLIAFSKAGEGASETSTLSASPYVSAFVEVIEESAGKPVAQIFSGDIAPLMKERGQVLEVKELGRWSAFLMKKPEQSCPEVCEPQCSIACVERGLPGKIRVGSGVKFKPSVRMPYYGRGPVKPSSQGVVKREGKDGDLYVEFPEHGDWRVKADDLILTEAVAEYLVMGVGAWVKRGPDWEWGEQDGGKGTVGEVIEPVKSGWVKVKWPSGRSSSYRWGSDYRYDLELVASAPGAEGGQIAVGSRVRIKASITRPKYGWGAVSHRSVGILREYDSDGDPVIDFPEQRGWHASPEEMELVTGPRPTPTGRIASGTRVRVKPSITDPKYGWGMVTHGSVGILREYDSDGDPVVDFPEQSGWHASPEELEVVSGPVPVPPGGIAVGSKVRVKPSISRPKYGWGAVTHGSVGTLRRYDSDGDPVIDFPEQSGWHATPDEIELVPGSGSISKRPTTAPVRLKPGMRVKRGPDWKWGEQDGGAGGLGTVISEPDPDSWVDVKWDAGGSNNYRWGADGKYDLEVVSEGDSSSGRTTKPTPGREIKVGMRVKRGPDWKWGDQDGGAGGLGTVTAGPDADMWVDVKWDAGESNNYRWGAEGKYDLEIVGEGSGGESKGDSPDVLSL